MADATFAAGSRGLSPVARSERVSARPNNAASLQTSDFGRDLAAEHSESVTSALRLVEGQGAQKQPGNGLLANDISFLLAETRTQEANAPLPPVSNFEKARNQYLETQAKVRDTVAANKFMREQSADAPDTANGQNGTNQLAIEEDSLI